MMYARSLSAMRIYGFFEHLVGNRWIPLFVGWQPSVEVWKHQTLTSSFSERAFSSSASRFFFLSLVVIFPHEYNFRKTARVAMHDVHDFYCFRSNSVNIIFVYCGCYRKYSIFLEFFRTWNIDINTRGMECVSRNVNFCRT